MRTYSGDELGETLTKTASYDYQMGEAYDSRDPVDPASVPGRSKVTITVGRDGDGKGNCTMTHLQPLMDGPLDHAATRILGPSPSGLSWHSGVWLGDRFTPSALSGFGTWRGRPVDVVTTYANHDSYQAMVADDWSISTWSGFAGNLNYGLAILPQDGAGTLRTIADGEQDRVWREVARNLKKHGWDRAIVRIGWESNLLGWRWGTSAENHAQFQQAYRRVVQQMRLVAPNLVFDFSVACGEPLAGSDDRLAPLKMPYPGDDVVDLVGCDTYDWWNTHADSDATWRRVTKPSAGPGLQDVVDFARAHGKGASFPEWGLSKNIGGNNGGGDNAYYIQAMHGFFTANRDVVAYECYFDESGADLMSSIYGHNQNPNAAAVYTRLW